MGKVKTSHEHRFMKTIAGSRTTPNAKNNSNEGAPLNAYR
jgi:hypothetical protein